MQNPKVLTNVKWNMRIGKLYNCLVYIFVALDLCVVPLDIVAKIVNKSCGDDFRNQKPTEKEKIVEALTRLN